MKKVVFSCLILCCELLCFGCMQNKKFFELENVAIVTSDSTTNVVRLAAVELQYFIWKTTGFKPEITSELPAGSKGIFVGGSQYTEAMQLPEKSFGEQEYLIDVTPERIVLMGQDTDSQSETERDKGRDNNGISPEKDRPVMDYGVATGDGAFNGVQVALPSIYDAQGTCYAVYDFIERFLGVRFFGPSPENVFIPEEREIKVSCQQIRRAPAIKYRHGTYTFEWPIVKEQYMEASGEMQQLFVRRLRMGGRKWAANHAFTGYQDRFLKKNPKRPELFESYHPEYFAKGRDGGASERQFCYTNPGFIRQVAKDAVRYFKEGKTIAEQVALGDYFAIVPLDNANWCTCEECQKLLALDKENIIGSHFNCGMATHYMWSFINDVAKEVKKEYPDSNKKLTALAYHVYAYLPEDIQLEDNIAVAPCLHPRNYWAPGMERNEMKFYKAWIEESKKSGRDVFLWNYLCFPTERGVIGKFNVFPGFNIHKLGEQIRMYAADQVKGVFFCGTGEQLDFYITMRLMDDPTLDTDQLMNDFFDNYFGQASESMKAFYTTIESVYSNSENYPENIQTEEAQFHQTEEIAWKYLGTPDVMEKLHQTIEQAQASARNDIEKCRVESWVEGVWKYMQEGYDIYNHQ